MLTSGDVRRIPGAREPKSKVTQNRGIESHIKKHSCGLGYFASCGELNLSAPITLNLGMRGRPWVIPFYCGITTLGWGVPRFSSGGVPGGPRGQGGARREASHLGGGRCLVPSRGGAEDGGRGRQEGGKGPRSSGAPVTAPRAASHTLYLPYGRVWRALSGRSTPPVVHRSRPAGPDGPPIRANRGTSTDELAGIAIPGSW